MGSKRHHRLLPSLPRLMVLRARVTGRNFFSCSDWARLSCLRSRNASSRAELEPARYAIGRKRSALDGRLDAAARCSRRHARSP